MSLHRFHRFDPKNCGPGRRRGLGWALLVGFAAGALSMSLLGDLVRDLGESVASLTSPAALRPAYSSEWGHAQHAVASDRFLRARTH